MTGEGLAEGTASTEGWRRPEAQARGRLEGGYGGEKQLIPHGLRLLHSWMRKVILSKGQERTWVWVA